MRAANANQREAGLDRAHGMGQLLQTLDGRRVFHIHAVLVQGQGFNGFQGLLRYACDRGGVKVVEQLADAHSRCAMR